MSRRKVDMERSKAIRAEVYRLRGESLPWGEIGAQLGITADMASAYYGRAIHQDGLPKHAKPPEARGMLREDSQQVGALMGAIVYAAATGPEPRNQVADKYAALKEACAGVGLKPSIVHGMIKRLEASFAPVMAEGKALTIAQIIPELERKMTMALAYMDDNAMAQASFKDLSMGFSVLAEKHQLLSGRPTMIVDMNTRMALREVLPALLAEAKRRGITVDGEAQRVEAAA